MWARPMMYWETPILLNILYTQHEPGSRSNLTGMLMALPDANSIHGQQPHTYHHSTFDLFENL
jgi:hypothetical protein